VLTPEKFPQASLDPVTDYGVTYFGTDGKSESTSPGTTSFTEQNEVGCMNLPAPAEQIQKLRAFGETAGFREALFVQNFHPGLGTRPFRWDCDGQSLAPLGSSALEHFPTP
jgi:hypothetical protein